MSIEKYDFTVFEKEGLPHTFTMIPNAVLQGIRNPEALAVWCYLFSKPTEWIPCKKELSNHFDGLGRDKLKKIFGYLHTHKLVDYVLTRNKDGTILSNKLIVKNGLDFVKNIVINQDNLSIGLKTSPQASSRGLKIQPLDYPAAGESAPIKKEYKINKEKAEKATARKKHRAPLCVDFFPDDYRLCMVNDKAREVGLTTTELLDKFKAIYGANGKLSDNWQTEFQIFLLRERKVSLNYYPRVNSEAVDQRSNRPAPKFWGPGHPSYDSLYGDKSKEVKHGSEISRDHSRGNGMRQATSFLL